MGFFGSLKKITGLDTLGDLWGGITGQTGADAARRGAQSANDAAAMFANRQEEANTFGLARAYQMLMGDNWAQMLAPGLNSRQQGMLGLDATGAGGAQGFGGGVLGGYGQLADASKLGYGQLGQQWQQAMNAHNPLETAKGYAGNREAQIREDSERDLKARNAQTRAALAGAGFSGSTTLANQMASNADATARSRDRSITDLGMQSTDRIMAAQGANRNAAMQGIGMQERGLGQQLGFQQMPLGLQSQLAFAAMNPGQVLPPTAGLNPGASKDAYMGNHWMNLLGMGLGGASLFM